MVASNKKELFEKIEKVCTVTDVKLMVEAVVNVVTSQRVVLASSLSIEDQVLTHILCSVTSQPRIFTLDTGRLFQQTYDTMERTMERYGFSYEIAAPETAELESMVAQYGPNLFYRSLENRKMCCAIRKTRPLKRVLATADAWICGLRREQSQTRMLIQPIEWDDINGIVKVNPLYNWSEEEVWKFIHTYNIPYNPLQDQGFRSLGCVPCTRAIGPHDNIRDGRWWWESPEHKECGLHRN